MPLKMYNEEKDSPKSKIKCVVGIAAGKGGVGKSTVTVNLARTLKNFGYHVGLLDADVYGPSMRKMLPEEQFPKQAGQWIIPAVCQGIHMISMAYFRKENEASVVRAPIANSIILQFIKNVAWGELDFLLVDFPPGTGDIQLTLCQKAPLSGVIMVTTPQQVAVLDVRKAMHMFELVGVPILGVVENMSYYPHPQSKDPLYLFGKDGGKNLAIEAGVPFLGCIPIDSGLCENADFGISPFKDRESEDLTMKCFHELAKHVEKQLNKFKETSKEAK